MKVLFCSAAGAGNIGDDAILEGLVRCFRTHVHDVEIGALSFCPLRTREHVALDHCWEVGRLGSVEAFRWASHVVLGGGSLITDTQGVDFPIGYFCDLIDLAIKHEKPVSMLAVGSSDLRDIRAKKLTAKYITKFVDVITLRSVDDQYNITKIGIPLSRSHVTADAAFCLYKPKKELPQLSLSKIGINVVSEHRDHVCEFVSSMKKALKLIQAESPELVFEGILSEVRKEPWADFGVTEEVLSECLGNKGQVYDRYLLPQEFCEFLSQFRLVITMRAHIFLFCAMMGVPCVGIVREAKVKYLMEMLDVPEELNLESDTSEIEAVVRVALANPRRYTAKAERVEELMGQAFTNAAIWHRNIHGYTLKVSFVQKMRSCLRWSFRRKPLGLISWRATELLHSILPFCFTRSVLNE